MELLGLEEQDAVQEELWEGRETLSMADLPTGWLLISANEGEFFSRPDLEAVSACGETLAWTYNTNVMVSEIRHFENGRQSWAISYDPGRDVRVSIEGEPPAVAIEIIDRLVESQAASDREGGGGDYVFEAPEEIGEALCGFNPLVIPDKPLEFAALYEARPRRKEPKKKGDGFLSRLFGRR